MRVCMVLIELSLLYFFVLICIIFIIFVHALPAARRDAFSLCGSVCMCVLMCVFLCVFCCVFPCSHTLLCLCGSVRTSKYCDVLRTMYYIIIFIMCVRWRVSWYPYTSVVFVCMQVVGDVVGGGGGRVPENFIRRSYHTALTVTDINAAMATLEAHAIPFATNKVPGKRTHSRNKKHSKMTTFFKKHSKRTTFFFPLIRRRESRRLFRRPRTEFPVILCFFLFRFLFVHAIP